MPEATELEYLKWFWSNCDFGPADSDVHAGMIEQFEREKGVRVPANYRDIFNAAWKLCAELEKER